MHARTDSPKTMNTHGNTFEQDYLRWYEERLNAPGKPFDPGTLAEAVRDQYPERPELAAAFARCTREWPESEFYTHFIAPKEHATRWKYAGGFFLEHPALGDLAVDTVHDAEAPGGIGIGGIEYLGRLFQRRDTEQACSWADDNEAVPCAQLNAVHVRAEDLPRLPDGAVAKLTVVPLNTKASPQ